MNVLFKMKQLSKTFFIIKLVLVLFHFQTIGQTLIRQIKPSDTDPAIQTFDLDSHYVYLSPSSANQNKLVVHLPGSYGEPKRATIFGNLAAELGFHSIGLMYPNIPTVGSLCANSNDPNCFEKTRGEIIEGIDYSNALDITTHESIFSRLRYLLVYLHANYPEEGWNQYLTTNNELNFPKIIFSGHSQGGGHAALIAKYYPIERALCFSSPKDWYNVSNSPAAWLSSGNWVCNPSNLYCFNHDLDEQDRQFEIWNAMGLNSVGTALSVDQFTTPYQHTHQLTTNFSVPIGDEHASTIQDNKTPKVNGEAVFIPVWTYMLTHTGTNGLSSDLENEWTITPNPFSDVLEVSVQNTLFDLKIIDQEGKILLIKDNNQGFSSFNTSNLPSGIYFIEIQTERGTLFKKLIK